MQFQVPQFIDTEDKIAGPLSMRQFIYASAASGISALLYFSVQPWLWIVLSIPVLALGAALAFAKVNGRPFAKFLFATLSFYWKPQTYTWQPDEPKSPKTPESVKDSLPSGSSGLSIEKLFTGMALKKTWSKVQNGAPPEEKKPKAKPTNEHYQVFQKISGEKKAAKRIDYR